MDFRLGVVDELSPDQQDARIVGRLAIPYLTRAGVVDIRFRCIRDHACSAAGCVKYLGGPGSNTRLYNVGSLFGGRPSVSVAEGELDAISLVQCGIPAVGVPGANNWKQHFNAILEDFADVYVFADGDEQGLKFATKLREHLETVTVFEMPSGMDVNSVMCDTGLGREYLVERLGRST